jgi:hypothetical protein
MSHPERIEDYLEHITDAIERASAEPHTFVSVQVAVLVPGRTLSHRK